METQLLWGLQKCSNRIYFINMARYNYEGWWNRSSKFCVWLGRQTTYLLCINVTFQKQRQDYADRHIYICTVQFQSNIGMFNSDTWAYSIIYRCPLSSKWPLWSPVMSVCSRTKSENLFWVTVEPCQFLILWETFLWCSWSNALPLPAKVVGKFWVAVLAHPLKLLKDYGRWDSTSNKFSFCCHQM